MNLSRLISEAIRDLGKRPGARICKPGVFVLVRGQDGRPVLRVFR